jgi:hypothetical protein
MNRQCGFLVLILGTLLVLVPGSTWAQDKYQLNIEAYRGINLGQMFGADANSNGISLAAFVDQLSVNLQQYHPNALLDMKLVAGAQYRLANLKAFIAKSAANDDGGIAAWPLRAFFEEDLKNKQFDSPGVQTAVQTLFSKYFEPLEAYGLTLPWLLVAQRVANFDFVILVYDTRFLERFGKLAIEDFYRIDVTDPLVDDELIELAQSAVKAGLLGAFSLYRDDGQAAVTVSAQGGVTINGLSSYKCCDGLTRVCRSITAEGTSCGLCGKYCCLGSTWCP